MGMGHVGAGACVGPATCTMHMCVRARVWAWVCMWVCACESAKGCTYVRGG